MAHPKPSALPDLFVDAPGAPIIDRVWQPTGKAFAIDSGENRLSRHSMSPTTSSIVIGLEAIPAAMAGGIRTALLVRTKLYQTVSSATMWQWFSVASQFELEQRILQLQAPPWATRLWFSVVRV